MTARGPLALHLLLLYHGAGARVLQPRLFGCRTSASRHDTATSSCCTKGYQERNQTKDTPNRCTAAILRWWGCGTSLCCRLVASSSDVHMKPKANRKVSGPAGEALFRVSATSPDACNKYSLDRDRPWTITWTITRSRWQRQRRSVIACALTSSSAPPGHLLPFVDFPEGVVLIPARGHGDADAAVTGGVYHPACSRCFPARSNPRAAADASESANPLLGGR